MKTPSKVTGDKQWVYGIILWFALGLFAYVQMIPFRLLLPKDSPHSGWQIGAVITLCIVFTLISPVLFFRVCSYFVHVAEQPSNDEARKAEQNVSASTSREAL